MSLIRPSTEADLPAITAITAISRQLGTIADCGWKFGRWLDIVLMERVVGAGSSTPPACK